MKRIYLTLVGLLFVGLQACTKYVDDINVDPNNPSDAPIENIFNAALTGIIIGQEGEDARLAGMWSRQFTGVDRQYSSLNTYNTTNDNFNWDKYYLAALNADKAIEKAVPTNNQPIIGISKVIKALMFGTVTSLWGDAPFSQANNFTQFPDPKYDPQVEIYAGVQKLLDEAITSLQSTITSPEANATDFYFGGDKAAWIRVAYTLKARYYLHVKNYQAAIDATTKGIQQSSQDWIIPHTTGQYNQDNNIYYNFGVDNRAGYMDASTALLPALLDTASAAYRGNTKTDESKRFSALYIGKEGAYDLNYEGFWAATAPFTILSSVENHLIAAEAYARSSNQNNALASLNAAREQLGVMFAGSRYEAYTLEDFASGGIANPTNKLLEDALLYEILEEKYASLVGQIEVFNDVRRTDNLLGIQPTNNNRLPERFLYPEEEVTSNSNVPSPIPGLFDPTPVNQ